MYRYICLYVSSKVSQGCSHPEECFFKDTGMCQRVLVTWGGQPKSHLAGVRKQLFEVQ